MTLAMMFRRSSLEMVKVDPEDWDYAEMEAMGWTLSMLAIIAAEMETIDLLRW